MKKLDKKQELRVLSNIKNLISNGSSRAVFRYGKKLIVKVAIDAQGEAQNEREVKIFSSHTTYKGLAKIFAYGKNIIIMEKLDTSKDPDDISMEPTDEEMDIYDFISVYNNETTDNYQIGYRKDGSAAAYDYGYISGDNETFVSQNLADFLYSRSTEAFLDHVKNIVAEV